MTVILVMFFMAAIIVGLVLRDLLRESDRLDPVEYAWGDGKDFTGLMTVIESPDFSIVLADTVMGQIEKEWNEAHPSDIEIAERVIAQKDELISSKSKLISSQRKQIEALERQVSDYRTHIRMSSDRSYLHTKSDRTYYDLIKTKNPWGGET